MRASALRILPRPSSTPRPNRSVQRARVSPRRDARVRGGLRAGSGGRTAVRPPRWASDAPCGRVGRARRSATTTTPLIRRTSEAASGRGGEGGTKRVLEGEGRGGVATTSAPSGGAKSGGTPWAIRSVGEHQENRGQTELRSSARTRVLSTTSSAAGGSARRACVRALAASRARLVAAGAGACVDEKFQPPCAVARRFSVGTFPRDERGGHSSGGTSPTHPLLRLFRPGRRPRDPSRTSSRARRLNEKAKASANELARLRRPRAASRAAGAAPSSCADATVREPYDAQPLRVVPFTAGAAGVRVPRQTRLARTSRTTEANAAT